MPVPELRFGVTYIYHAPDVVEQARHLEELGFDYAAWAEHFMAGNPPIASHLTLPLLAVAAGATTRIRLLSAAIQTPLYHPMLLAKLTSSLDIASGGRLTLGIGVGGEFPEEFEAMGVPVKERGARTDETLQLLKRLWTEEHVTHEGRHYRLRNVTLNPPPFQRPHPPIWVGGREAPAMRRAARYGDGWFPYLYTPGRYRSSVEEVRRIAAKEGRDLSHFQWALFLPIAIGDDPKQATRTAAHRLARTYQADPHHFTNLVDRVALVGPPETCAQRLQEYIDAGARHIIFNNACESEDIPRHTERIARELLPHFKARAPAPACRRTPGSPSSGGPGGPPRGERPGAPFPG